jgi:hypothetical protein
MLKDSTAIVKLRTLEARYYCQNCGYLGPLVWEDGDFKKVGGIAKSKWLRKRLRRRW